MSVRRETTTAEIYRAAGQHRAKTCSRDPGRGKARAFACPASPGASSGVLSKNRPSPGALFTFLVVLYRLDRLDEPGGHLAAPHRRRRLTPRASSPLATHGGRKTPPPPPRAPPGRRRLDRASEPKTYPTRSRARPRQPAIQPHHTSRVATTPPRHGRGRARYYYLRAQSRWSTTADPPGRDAYDERAMHTALWPCAH